MLDARVSWPWMTTDGCSAACDPQKLALLSRELREDRDHIHPVPGAGTGPGTGKVLNALVKWIAKEWMGGWVCKKKKILCTNH